MTVTCTGTYEYPLFLWVSFGHYALFSPATSTMTSFVQLDDVYNSQFEDTSFNIEAVLQYYNNSITAVYTSFDTTISFEQFKSYYPEYFL